MKDRVTRNELPKPCDLTTFKNKRKAKRILADLESVSAILCTAKRLLTPYQKYVPAKEIIETISTNEHLIQIHIKKFKQVLGEES